MASDSAILTELQRISQSLDSNIRVIVMGPPASGKTTQSERFAAERGICRITVGDLLRQSAALGTPVGRWIKSITDKGELVPDELALGLIADGIKQPACSKGFVLDGYPRTLPQAMQLEKLLKTDAKSKGFDAVFYMKIEENPTLRDQVLLHRLHNRLIHVASGRVYHTNFIKPKKSGLDDLTGDPLEHRSDDNVEVLKTRLRSFQNDTQPVLSFYKYQGLVQEIEGTVEPDTVQAKICQAFTAQLNANLKAASAPPPAAKKQPRTIHEARCWKR